MSHAVRSQARESRRRRHDDLGDGLLPPLAHVGGVAHRTAWSVEEVSVIDAQSFPEELDESTGNTLRQRDLPRLGGRTACRLGLGDLLARPVVRIALGNGVYLLFETEIPTSVAFREVRKPDVERLTDAQRAEGRGAGRVPRPRRSVVGTTRRAGQPGLARGSGSGRASRPRGRA